MTRRLGGRSAGGGTDPDDLHLLSHSVDVEEGPGGDRDVRVEENPLWSSVDSTEHGSIKAESKAEFISLLRVRKDVLGVHPVLRSLGKEVAVLGKLSGAQMTRVCPCQTKGKAANVGTLRLKNSDN